MTRRPIIGLGAVAVVVTIALVFALGSAPATPPPGSPAAALGSGATPTSEATALPTAHPVPGHEVFGFVPYWEMNGDIAAHLAKTPLTTLALFSVTHTKDGAIDTKQTGYKRITGSIGEQLISEAHARGTAVQLVYSSLGKPRNERLF